MAGRGPQSFKKRQREQARKEKQDEKRTKRVERKALGPMPEELLEKNPILEELEGYLANQEESERARENAAMESEPRKSA
jgi:hypothetical protein